MMGFGASVAGEWLTGQGALHRLSAEIDVPVHQIAVVLVGIVVVNTAVALSPLGSTYNMEEQEQRIALPPGPLQDSRISLLTPLRFLGIKEFGFTPENELFVGRLAQLGFLASLIGEWVTGKGALAQLAAELKNLLI